MLSVRPLYNELCSLSAYDGGIHVEEGDLRAVPFFEDSSADGHFVQSQLLFKYAVLISWGHWRVAMDVLEPDPT